jgi:hypothetical protein
VAPSSLHARRRRERANGDQTVERRNIPDGIEGFAWVTERIREQYHLACARSLSTPRVTAFRRNSA